GAGRHHLGAPLLSRQGPQILPRGPVDSERFRATPRTCGCVRRSLSLHRAGTASFGSKPMLGQDGSGLRPFVARRREEEGHATMNRQQQIEAAVVLFAAMLYLTGSFWKAILVSVLVLVSCVLGFGLRGSFAIAIVAIAVVLGAPSPDQWVQLWQD